MLCILRRIGLSGPASVLSMIADDVEAIALFERTTERTLEGFRLDAFGEDVLLMAHAAHSRGAPESVKKMLGGFDPVTRWFEVVRRGQAPVKIFSFSAMPRMVIAALEQMF